MPGVYTVEKDGVQKPIAINRLGNGLRFVSTGSNRILLPDTTSFNFQHNSFFTFSFSFVFKASSASQTLFCNQLGTLAQVKGMAIFLAGNGTNIDVQMTAVANPIRIYKGFYFSQPLTDGQYCHIEISKTGSLITDLKCKLNGVEVTNVNVLGNTLGTAIIDYTGAKTVIGARYVNGTTFDLICNSYLHSLKVFNRGLTSVESKKLYISDNAVGANDYIASWNFEHKSGTLLFDQSNDGLNGELINFSNTSLGPSNAWVNNLQQPITS